MKIRIAKFISNSGFCSRRKAEKLILDNQVFINGQICSHPSQKVSDEDEIKIRNKILKKIERVELWKMNKPVKYICSTKDSKKRKIIFDILPKKLRNFKSVGRLDYMSEGLILFTNSGEYSRFLELPSSNLERTYRVCITGNVTNQSIQKINKGVKINNISYDRVKLKIEKKLERYVWLIFKLKEGKNREIRNICKYFSWNIVKLLRIEYGPYKLGNLKVGEIEKIRILKNDKNNSRKI